jgi:hypothetical protein
MKTQFRNPKAILAAAAVLFVLGSVVARSDIVNVARRGTGYSNRPLYGGWSMSRLIDGDLGTIVHSGANPGVGLAYSVNLGKGYKITQLKIYPRQDGCCPERLNRFRVSIHADDGTGKIGAEVWGVSLFTDPASNAGSGPGVVVTIDPPAPQTGQWIQILALADPVPDYFLQMNELEVYAEVPPAEVNRALGAPASANGPLYSNYQIVWVVDGNAGRFVHGASADPTGFAYDINLGAAIALDKIVIWARQDGCCPDRLANYRVSIHKDNNGAPGDMVWKTDRFTDGVSNAGSGPGAKDEIVAALDPTGTFTGQWIRIQSLADPVPPYSLQIGDIEAYGLPAGAVQLIISAGPQDAATGWGATATFGVTALAGGGDANQITYQWQKEGVDIPGANAATYRTPPVGASDDGKKFQCVVGYPGVASQTTAAATLSLDVAYHTAVTANQPTYANWPTSWLVDGNRLGALHLAANLSPGAAYEIDLGIPYALSKIVIWARQDGCCPERLTNFRLSVHADDAGQIGAEVWKADFFTDGTYPPSAAGSKVEVTANADPAGQFTGQWVRILSLEDPVQNYALQMTEFEAYGAPVGGVKLVINQQPQSVSVGLGQSATLTVSAAAPGGDPAAITYQWQMNGANIDGATQASYQTPAVTVDDDGKKYRCIVGYTGLTSLTTDEASVRVNLAYAAAASSNRPLIDGRSASQLTDGNRSGVGGNIIHGLQTIEPPFFYDINLGIAIQMSQIVVWARQDGAVPERLSNYRLSVHKDNQGQIGDMVWHADLHTDGSNPGSTPGSKDEAVASLDPAGTFTGQWIRIQSLDDPIPSYALQMCEVEVYGTYAAQAPVLSFVTQPGDVVTSPGRTVRFSAVGKVVNGDPAKLTYQWQKNGANISGATASAYVTPPLAEADANAKFRCVLSHPGATDAISAEGKVAFDFNYARSQPASSNRPLYGGYQPSQLVDGDRRNQIHGNTAIAAGFAYEIDLGLDVNVDRIDLYPRQDSCCPERLTNFRLLLFKDNQGRPGDEVWYADLFTDGSYPDTSDGTVVAVAESQGTGTFRGAHWIRVLSLDNPPADYALQIAEIELYGHWVPAPTLSIERVGANILIHFSGGTLESTDRLGGAWNPVPGAVDPYPVTPDGAQRFYRAKQ